MKHSCNRSSIEIIYYHYMLIVYFIKIFCKIVQRSGEPPQSKCSAKDAMFCSSGPMLLCVCLFVFALFDAGNLAAAHVAGSAAVFAAVESLKTFEPFSCGSDGGCLGLEKRIPSEASGNRCHMSR